MLTINNIFLQFMNIKGMISKKLNSCMYSCSISIILNHQELIKYSLHGTLLLIKIFFLLFYTELKFYNPYFDTLHEWREKFEWLMSFITFSNKHIIIFLLFDVIELKLTSWEKQGKIRSCPQFKMSHSPEKRGTDHPRYNIMLGKLKIQNRGKISIASTSVSMTGASYMTCAEFSITLYSSCDTFLFRLC